MWTDITYAQRMRLLGGLHPNIAFQFYCSETISLEDFLRVLEPVMWDEANVFPVVKLHSFHGKSIKQAVRCGKILPNLLPGVTAAEIKGDKTKMLVHILQNAAPQDLLEDVLSIATAATRKYMDREGSVTLQEIERRMASGGLLYSKLKWNPNFWSSYCPMQTAAKGTYSNVHASIKRCHQEFQRGGAQRAFKIKFTGGAAVINGTSVILPNYLTWSGKDVMIEAQNSIGFIDAEGGAVFYGCTAAYQPLLKCWDSDALSTSEIIGKTCSSCIWCGRELTDPTSVKQHAGPVCSPRYSKVLQHIGPITGTTLVVPTSTTRPVTLSSGEILNIPERVVEASPFLQGLFDTESSEIDAAKFLGVTSEALTLLDEILGDESWLPDSIENLELVLPVADKLGLSVTTRLEKLYTQMCPRNLRHWAGWEDVTTRATTRRGEMKRNGTVTHIEVTSKKRKFY